MSTIGFKRTTQLSPRYSSTKRARTSEQPVERLCDLANAEELFFDPHAASTAKETGFFRNRS